MKLRHLLALSSAKPALKVDSICVTRSLDVESAAAACAHVVEPVAGRTKPVVFDPAAFHPNLDSLGGRKESKENGISDKALRASNGADFEVLLKHHWLCGAATLRYGRPSLLPDRLGSDDWRFTT